jgi:hypothetical protein
MKLDGPSPLDYHMAAIAVKTLPRRTDAVSFILAYRKIPSRPL